MALPDKYYRDGCHLYTTSYDEFTYWTTTDKFDLNNDGIAAYISPVPLPYTVPMWNMVKNNKFFAIKAGGSEIINWAIKFRPLDFSVLLNPTTPTNLTASSFFLQKQPSLYWKDNAVNETGYVIERKAAGGSFAKLTQVAANQTKYTDNSAEAGITYYYRVKAVNGSTSSAYSNEAAASVYALPEVKIPKIPTIKPGEVTMLFTLNKNNYLVNGVPKTMDVSPVSINGRTMLPIRFAADPLGADTAWNGAENKVTVTMGAATIELWIGENRAVINGASVQIDAENPDVKPLIINSRTMLPMRFVTEKLGCEVEWIPETSQIKVKYPGTWLDPQPEPPMK